MPDAHDPSPSAPTPSAGTSLTLLDRLRGNDAEAWERVVRLYGPLVLFWGRRAGLSEADAADLLQDVFRSVAGAIAGFRLDRAGDTFRGWLWTITRNKLRDHFRNLAREPVAAGGTEAQDRFHQIPEAEPDSSPESEPSKALLHRALESVRPAFEERTWQAFWRTTVDGRPPADVAAELGLGLASVYQARTRVLRRLRQELGGVLDQ
jgi:RNA polymerase sigma-70 factor (ECF subfamily)